MVTPAVKVCPEISVPASAAVTSALAKIVIDSPEWVVYAPEVKRAVVAVAPALKKMVSGLMLVLTVVSPSNSSQALRMAV